MERGSAQICTPSELIADYDMRILLQASFAMQVLDGLRYWLAALVGRVCGVVQRSRDMWN